MKELAQLGLELNESIPLEILLGENFNGTLYGMTQEDSAKVRALRQVVTQYNRTHCCDKTHPVTDSAKAAGLVYGMLKDLSHEEVWVAYLSACNTVISVDMVFKGAIDNVLISPRVILAKALSLDASNLILYHNHPSGSVMPSPSDIKMTANLKKACTLLEVNLLDHLIISKDLCYSFADERSFRIRNNDSMDIK